MVEYQQILDFVIYRALTRARVILSDDSHARASRHACGDSDKRGHYTECDVRDRCSQAQPITSSLAMYRPASRK